jgi:hypothetical protein
MEGGSAGGAPAREERGARPGGAALALRPAGAFGGVHQSVTFVTLPALRVQVHCADTPRETRCSPTEVVACAKVFTHGGRGLCESATLRGLSCWPCKREGHKTQPVGLQLFMGIRPILVLTAACGVLFGISFVVGGLIQQDGERAEPSSARSTPPVTSDEPALALGRAADLPELRKRPQPPKRTRAAAMVAPSPVAAAPVPAPEPSIEPATGVEAAPPTPVQEQAPVTPPPPESSTPPNASPSPGPDAASAQPSPSPDPYASHQSQMATSGDGGGNSQTQESKQDADE